MLHRRTCSQGESNAESVENREFSMQLDLGGVQDDPYVLSAPSLRANPGSRCGTFSVLNEGLHITFCPCWYDKWEDHFFVLAGSFLFHYMSNRDDEPCGAPIPIEAIHVTQMSKVIFKITTVREKLTLKCSSDFMCNDWIKAIRERKLDVIKESMNHKTPSSRTVAVDKLANKLYSKYIHANDTDTSEYSSLISMTR